jgi:Eukaryotic-type carbonic anhydrase
VLFLPLLDTRVQPGWPTNWKQFNDFLPYDNITNHCLDCSTGVRTIPTAINLPHIRKCRKGLQSPIDLRRKITARRPCLDRHRMHAVKGNCSFADLNFQILPHVLRAYQPRKSCDVAPNIDFSFGYPVPWLLEFTDISAPSQHTQDGRRYDAEVVLSHTYSISNASDRYIGNVAIFLEIGKDEDHYDFLELYLREWIQTAVNTRKACKGRLDREDEVDWEKKFGKRDNDKETAVKEKWSWLLQESAKVDGPDKSRVRDSGARDLRRQLVPSTVAQEMIDKNWYQGPWHPYDWVVKTRTEYYFRYLGSLLEPPCFVGVHWRVMRRSIKISPRQLDLIEKLLLFRLNPGTCKRDTAAKTTNGKNGMKVDVSRPRQQLYNIHELVYCECVDWNSSKVEDKIYCKGTMEERGVSELTHTYRPSSSPTRAPPL